MLVFVEGILMLILGQNTGIEERRQVNVPSDKGELRVSPCPSGPYTRTID